jgi:hypothetical protein
VSDNAYFMENLEGHLSFGVSVKERLRVIIRCKHKKWFEVNRLCDCCRMFLAFTCRLRKKQGGMCYTIKM